MKKNLQQVDVKNKKVLIRCDYNVPIKNQVIQDNNRIIQSLKTIKYLIENNAKIIIFSHLGRIKSQEDCLKNSLQPIALELEKLLGQKVIFSSQTRGEELENKINNLQNGEILLVENTRFEDLSGQKESKNDSQLGSYWASLGDIFVNDAFGMTHRAHASNDGIASHIKDSCVGFLIEKELKMLSKALINPKKPIIAIIGGAKISDKIGVIKNMLTKADKIIIGGGMAYTFLKAKNLPIGKSLLEEEKIDLAKNYLLNNQEKIILPIDHSCNKKFNNDQPQIFDAIPDDYMGLDIGPKSIALFQKHLQNAKTIIWNGPMGVFELSNYAKGTNEICKLLASLDDTYTIIGGGDSAAAAISLGYKDDFSHISTGGGASLVYMEGKELVGIKAIDEQ